MTEHKEKACADSFLFEKAVGLIHHVACVQWISDFSWALENKDTSTMGWILPLKSEPRLWFNGSRMRPNWHGLRHFLTITIKKKKGKERISYRDFCVCLTTQQLWATRQTFHTMVMQKVISHCSTGRKEALKVASVCSQERSIPIMSPPFPGEKKQAVAKARAEEDNCAWLYIQVPDW